MRLKYIQYCVWTVGLLMGTWLPTNCGCVYAAAKNTVVESAPTESPTESTARPARRSRHRPTKKHTYDTTVNRAAAAVLSVASILGVIWWWNRTSTIPANLLKSQNLPDSHDWKLVPHGKMNQAIVYAVLNVSTLPEKASLTDFFAKSKYSSVQYLKACVPKCPYWPDIDPLQPKRRNPVVNAIDCLFFEIAVNRGLVWPNHATMQDYLDYSSSLTADSKPLQNFALKHLPPALPPVCFVYDGATYWIGVLKTSLPSTS